MANFVGAGTGVTIATGSGAVTAAGSGVAVGDIVVLQVLQDGVAGSAVSLSGISGVANLAGTASSLSVLAAAQPVGTLALQHLWIGRATSTTVTVTVATTGDDLYYRIYVFRGILRTATTLATILENSTAGTVTNATGTVAAIADTGVTSIGTDRLAVNFVAVDDDNPVGPFTGMTGGTWVEATAEFASATGTDGCIQLQIADLSAAGTINGGSFTMSAADNWGVVGFAFIPVAVTADTGTVGFKFTPSASDTYTPSVPTTDAATASLILTPSSADVYAPSVPTTDSGTVSLLLTVLTTTAFNTYAETGAVLDNFNRADQEPPGGIWGPEPVSSAHTALQVVGNRLSGTVLGNNSGRIVDVDYGPDVFATFEIGTAGNEIMGIYLRLQEIGATPTGYQITIDLNGLIVMYRQPGGNFLGSIACPAGLVSGDKFGVEMVGSRLRAYVNDISTGLGWVLVLERSDSTITAAGEIGVNMTHLTQTIDNLYGGNVPVDTAQYVDSDTGGLLLVASAVEDYTPSVPTTDAGTPVVVLTVEGVDEYTAGVTGVEYVDSATVTLALTPIIPITTRLLDDFNRANGSIGSNWSTPLLAESQTVLNIASNQAKSQDGTQADNYWNADIFTGDVEASVTVKDYAVGNIILLVINANLSTGSNYLAVIQPSGSGSTADYSIYRVNVSGSYSQIASASGPISVGSNVSLKRVGDTVSIRQNGVQVVSILDTSALSNTGTLYVGLGASATQVRLDDFIVSTPAETFHGVDSGVGVLTLTAAGVELIELVDAAEAAITFTGSSTDVLTAAVTFPTTFVIDNFQRAGGSPGLVGLGSHWVTDTLNLGAVPPDALNGLMYNPSDLYTEIYFNWSPFGPDVEVFFTYAQASGGTSFAFGGMARISNPDSSSVSGYRFLITDVDGLVKISKYITGTETVLASTAFTATLGSQYGMSCIGNEITVFEDGVPILSVTDSSIAGSSTNRIGVWSYGGASSTDEIGLSMFGGGNVGAMSEASDYSDLIIADEALAYWRLGENGSTVAYDFTNHGWSGLHVTSAADGVAGAIIGDSDLSCLFVSSDDERIRTWLSQYDHIYQPPFGDGMSLECWHYRPASVGTGPKDMGLLGSWNNGTGGGLMLWISFFTADYGMTLNQTSGDYLNSGSDPQLGVWEHIVGVYEQTSDTTGVKSLYVNGELVATAAHSPASIGAGRAFDIATYDQNSGVTLDGRLDEAAVYEYPLTAAQVLEHYELGSIGSGPVEYVDAATLTLNLDVVAAFPYGQPILDNFNRANAGTLGSNWIPLVPADARWRLENGETFNDHIEWTNEVWATAFAAGNIFAWAEISGAHAGEGHLWLAQEVNTATPDGYAMQINAAGATTLLTRMNNNASLEYLQIVSTPWAVGDMVGISFDGSIARGYRKAAGSDRWQEIASGIPSTFGSGIVYPVNYVGIGQEQATGTWRFTNFGGGTIPSVIELDTFHSVEAATVGLVFTPSAVEEYTPFEGVITTDSATVPLTFTVTAIELREFIDAATVTLNLDVVAAFPYGQPILDNFNRADSTGLGSSWEHLVSTDNHWDISNGKMSGVNAYVNDAWVTEFEARHLFMWAELAQLGTDAAYLFFASEVDTLLPDGWGITFYATGSTTLTRLSNNALTDFAIPTSVSVTWAVGDLVGMSLDDMTITVYRKPVGEPWREILKSEVSPLADAPAYPSVAQMSVGERPNATSWQFTNFGGGSIPSVIELDSLHSVEAATVGLVFTLSAVEEYTTVTGTEYTDSATASVLFTPGVASVAAGATLLDDFNRADASTWGANWTKVVSRGNTDIKIASNQAHFDPVGERAYAWNPVLFGSDQEASFITSDISYNSSRLFFLLCANNPTAGDYTGYLLEVLAAFSDLNVNIYRATNNSFSLLGAVSGIAYGGAPFGEGDVWTARKVGDQLSMLRNGVVVAGPYTDPSPLVTGPYWLGVGGNANDNGANTTKIDDFYGGTYGVSTSGETFQGVDAQTVGLVLTASGTELELVVDSATASVIFTPSGVDDHSAGGVFTDSATASVLFTVSSTEIAGVVDAQTVTATLTPSALEARISTDAATAAVVFTPSTIETQEALDAATIRITVTGTTVEAKEAQDAATAVLGLYPTAVVSFAGSDSALTTLVLSPSAVEDYTTGGVFTDAATARLTLTASSTEAFTVSDSATVSVVLTVTSVETYGRTDAATASVLFTPSGVDTYTTASAYVDTATAFLGLAVSAVEGRERQDTGTATLALTVTYASAYGTTDATTAPLLLSGSALFERATISTATVPFAFTITSTEEIAQEDAATLYFRLTPKTALVFDNPLLLGVLSSTWRGGMQARSYSATVSSRTFDTTITAPRFTATVSVDMTGDIDSHFAGTIRR